MSHTIPVQEAAGRLADLISALNPGDEITLTSNNKAVAKIIPQPSTPPLRRAGACKGMLVINREDDAHLEDFKDYM